MGKNKQFNKREKRSKFKIKVTKNGPYVVTGGVPLYGKKIVLDADGQSLEWRETKKYAELQT